MDIDALQRRLRATLPMARLDCRPLPGCPEISLALINDDFPLGPLPPDVMRDVIARPAYWSLCWGSGLALARYLLDRPELVRGRRVVDLGAGSGVVAIAAAMAGAARVIACDSDQDALAATATNAALNDVEVSLADDLAGLPEDNDLMLMADVLYDRENLPLLAAAAGYARAVLVADSRIAELPDPAYDRIGTIDTLTYPNLGEFDEFGTVRLFYREAIGDGSTSSTVMSSR